MLYLDTGCLLKLYYPEANSAAIVDAVSGHQIVFTALHELETQTALQLKCFRGEATKNQAEEAMKLVREDLAGGKLIEPAVDWLKAMARATELARVHAAANGCRSLDVLHCALVLETGAHGFVSTDRRQAAIAAAMGLPIKPVRSQR